MDIFNALAVEKRREIVELVAERGQMSASDISSEFQVTAAAISQHLKVLRETEVLHMEKHAQKRLYAINPEAFGELESWARRMKQTWSARFDQLAGVLENDKAT